MTAKNTIALLPLFNMCKLFNKVNVEPVQDILRLTTDPVMRASVTGTAL